MWLVDLVLEVARVSKKALSQWPCSGKSNGVQTTEVPSCPAHGAVVP